MESTLYTMQRNSSAGEPRADVRRVRVETPRGAEEGFISPVYGRISLMAKTGKLSGHRALVTGASSGIGEQYARQLAELGADLVLVARRAERLQKLASDLEAVHGIRATVIPCDLGAPGAVRKVFGEATAGGARISILINNAGIGKWSPFAQVACEDHLATAHLNMTVPTELAYLCIQQMRTQPGPCYITNISSIATFQPVMDFAVYSGTKAYLTSFSEILAAELSDTSIHVTCVCPGGTLTEFLDHAGQKLTASGRLGMMTADAVVRIGIRGMLAGRRLVIPGVFNQLVCFLPRLIPRRLALWLATTAMRRAVQKA